MRYLQIIDYRPPGTCVVSAETAHGIVRWLKLEDAPIPVETLSKTPAGVWHANAELVLRCPYTSRAAPGNAMRTTAVETGRLESLRAAIERMGGLSRFTLPDLHAVADEGLRAWLVSPVSRRPLSALLGKLGYDRHTNPNDKQGAWFDARTGVRVRAYIKRLK